MRWSDCSCKQEACHLHVKARPALPPPVSPLVRGRRAEGGAEWHTVTGGKARLGGIRRAVIKAIQEWDESLQQTAAYFEAASAAERKRKAEESVNDKLAAMS